MAGIVEVEEVEEMSELGNEEACVGEVRAVVSDLECGSGGQDRLEEAHLRGGERSRSCLFPLCNELSEGRRRRCLRYRAAPS